MVPVMQRELNEFKDTVWNTHRIRAQKDTLMADGVPDHIYEFPDRYGMQKKGTFYNHANSSLPCKYF